MLVLGKTRDLKSLPVGFSVPGDVSMLPLSQLHGMDRYWLFVVPVHSVVCVCVHACVCACVHMVQCVGYIVRKCVRFIVQCP